MFCVLPFIYLLCGCTYNECTILCSHLTLQIIFSMSLHYFHNLYSTNNILKTKIQQRVSNFLLLQTMAKKKKTFFFKVPKTITLHQYRSILFPPFFLKGARYIHGRISYFKIENFKGPQTFLVINGLIEIILFKFFILQKIEIKSHGDKVSLS